MIPVLDLGNFGSGSHRWLSPLRLGTGAVGFMWSCSTALPVPRGDHRGNVQYSLVANMRQDGQSSGFTSLTAATDPQPGGREDYGRLTTPLRGVYLTQANLVTGLEAGQRASGSPVGKDRL